jgi:hypothetical protein
LDSAIKKATCQPFRNIPTSSAFFSIYPHITTLNGFIMAYASILDYSQYDENPRLPVGRTSGNEILVARVLKANEEILYTQHFEDSRVADVAIRDAKEALARS